MSNIEINSDCKLDGFFHYQMTARLPFLVNMRLVNLVYASTFESFRTDKSLVTAALIAHAPSRANDLGEKLSDYHSTKVRDFKPEVKDMRTSRSKRPMNLHETDVEATGIKVPEPVYERLGLLVDEARDYEYSEEVRVNLSTVTAALITSAAVDGGDLRELVEAYQAVTVGEFDPAVGLSPA